MDKLKFETAFEKERIERRYEGKVRNKFFKLTWHHWGMVQLPDDTVVQKTWILGSHGQVWQYDITANGEISPLHTHLILEGDMLWLRDLLNRGFEQIETREEIKGEGFEMVWYAQSGRVRHKYMGDVFENEYLQKIISMVEIAVMREWVLVQKGKR